jgi:HEAT repeat protein
MLEGLEDIDWGKLNHAYGAATDVPDLLRTLASPTRQERSRAVGELYGNIWHQGTVYEATGFAVPFLVELLRGGAVKGKTEILGLLQAISGGNSYLEVHQDLDWYRHERQTAAFRERLRQEIVWVCKAKEAVSAGIPTYRELLAGPSVRLRIWSAYVLANCTGRFAEAASALRGQLRRERHPLARASLVWAWASLARDARTQGPAGPSSCRGLSRTLWDLVRSRKEAAITRLLAGLGLMQFLPEKEFLGFARFFAAALARCPRSLARLPWTEGEPMHFVYRVLAHQRSLVLSLLSTIVQTPGHPYREETTYHLEEIILAQPRARPAIALLFANLLDVTTGKARQYAARLLGSIGSAGRLARDNLTRALGDADPEVARSAAVALSKMGDMRAVPFLKQRLLQGDAHHQVLDAVKRFGRGARETIPLLRELLQRSTGNTQIYAAQALALMGEASTEAVLEVADVLWDPTAGAGAGWALMLWGPLAHAAVPRILEFLQDEGAAPLARLNAIKALGSMGLHARPAVGLLEHFLPDPSPELRVAAAAALWNVSPRAAQVVPVLVEVLQESKGKPRANHACASALEALEVIGPAGRSAAPLVRELLDDPYQWTRVRAARALWRMGEPVEVFLPVLVEELRCRPVGRLAAECLTEIGPPAATAVPRLREILSATGSISEGGALDEIVDGEEAFLRAAAAALQSIQGD